MHISEILHLTLYARMEPDVLIIIIRNSIYIYIYIYIYLYMVTAVSVVFWVNKPSRLVIAGYQNFRGICHPYIQDERWWRHCVPLRNGIVTHKTTECTVASRMKYVAVAWNSMFSIGVHSTDTEESYWGTGRLVCKDQQGSDVSSCICADSWSMKTTMKLNYIYCVTVCCYKWATSFGPIGSSSGFV